MYPDAPPQTGSGTAAVFTGYEWRGWLKSGDEEVLQVLALSEDGTELSGRWFFEDPESQGGDLRAIRSGSTATPAILAVDPPYLRVGETATIAVHGVGLDGPVNLGEGVEISETITEGPYITVVQARATDAASDGVRTISVGPTEGDGMFTVYRDIDSIRVEPDYAIARVGGAGGPIPPPCPRSSTPSPTSMGQMVRAEPTTTCVSASCPQRGRWNPSTKPPKR